MRKSLFAQPPTASWWIQFRGAAGSLEIKPYRFLFITDLEQLPDSWIGRLVVRASSIVERLLPPVSVRLGAYYAVVIDKAR
jgi:hypothetical protein